MSINNGKLPISPRAPVVHEHDPSLNRGGRINSFVFSGNRDKMQNGSAEAFIYSSKKLEDAMKEIGLKIKHHEDNIKFLKAEKNRLDHSILDVRVALGMIHSASGIGTGSENKESSNGRNEEEIIDQILRYDKSAAGIYCQLQTRHGTQITHDPSMKDVMGIVALLGKVDDDNLSRILSDYLGVETMFAVVCKTHEGLQALETCYKEASIGKPLDDRYLVICLENFRPYRGEFISGDPHRRLAIKKPRFLNEETPGFLGFAVNMINIDTTNLYGVTSEGHGLRETLFYNLFSRLQVYRTREEMLQALPLITDGAISLDGGIIKTPGVSALGEREVEIKFPKSSARSSLPENYFDTESRMKELEWKRKRYVEDLRTEEVLLEHAKLIFEIKKEEFSKFLARSSSYVTASSSGNI
ncbi:unnamed protein product [Withania somnifera]